MNVLDLFSGIGGFSLGLERAGMRTVAFCEVDPFCRRVLAKHWPNVPCYDDVRTLTAERLRADGISVDIITGGFPCQDISIAGKGAGIAGERSGLWTEYARIIGELRPRYAIVENVPAILGRGLDVVLGDLAALGFGAEWHCIPASALGAPHRRDRWWLVAYPEHGRDAERARPARRSREQRTSDRPGHAGEARHASDATLVQHGEQGAPRQRPAGWQGLGCGGASAPNPSSDAVRHEPRWRHGARGSGAAEPRHDGASGAAADAGLQRLPERGRLLTQREIADAAASAHLWRLTEPAVCRADDGIPHRVDRLRALGNAVVPQIPEIIGRAIMTAHSLGE